jgi:hypothetical protein
MSSMTRIRTALAVLLLAGCQAAPAPGSAAAAGSRPAAAAGQIKLRASYEAARPAARRLQTAVSELTAASLHHVDVKLSVQDGATEQPIGQTTLNQGEFEDEITFGNLKNDRTYYARAYAFTDSAGTDKVSLDAQSFKSIVVGQDDAPTLETLVVTLKAVAFSGTATSAGVTIGPGIIQHTGNESVSLGK